MLTARFPLPASPTSWGRWREAPEEASLPGAKTAFISAAKRSITDEWRARAFQTLLMSARSMPRAWAMPSTTAFARGLMSLYSISLAMVSPANDKGRRRAGPHHGASEPLVHMLAAIDRQRRAGDETGIVGDQEHHAAGDFIGLAEPADRDLGDDLLQHVGRHRRDHIGLGVAGRDGVHGDALGRAFLGQCLGEAVNARLGGGVVDLAILAALAVDRTDIDDTAEAALVHALPHRLGHVEAGAEIGVDHGVPHVARQLAHGRITGDAGVVHQHFDRTEIALDLADDRLTGGEIADVELVDGDAGLRLELLRRVIVAGVGGRHLVAFVLQHARNSGADAARSARHDCNTSRHFFLPYVTPTYSSRFCGVAGKRDELVGGGGYR